ncbi:unnamed protein product [Trichobilharzia szidati]|nr:unnamed protein product [Trichobilharzia szidati]CAH8867207.1 unnamed protein product [Trichobilharzia szidati]
MQRSDCCFATPQLSFENHLVSDNVSFRRRLSKKGSSGKSKSVNFSDVTTYSFERQQGSSSIPDTGWCTIGMAQKHFGVSRLDLHQYRLLRRLRRKQRGLNALKDETGVNTSNRGRGRGRMRGRAKRVNNNCRSPGDSCRVPNFSPPPLSPQVGSDNPLFTETLTDGVYATPPPPYLTPPSPRRLVYCLDDPSLCTSVFNSLDLMDTDSEASLDHAPPLSSPGRKKSSRQKLMPLNSAERIRLLRSSGITKIDGSERLVCSFIRTMRSRVGCNCGPTDSCKPGRCSCADEGIPCQVDRESFPCTCAATGCCNPSGRNEFSREQVRAHAEHVLARVSSKSPIKPVKSPRNVSGGVMSANLDLSTSNGACTLCSLDSSKTILSSSTPLSSFTGNNMHQKPVHNSNSPTNNSQWLLNRSNIRISSSSKNISPIPVVNNNNNNDVDNDNEIGWLHQCSEPIRTPGKKNRSVALNSIETTIPITAAGDCLQQNSSNPPANFTPDHKKNSRIVIDLTLSPSDGDDDDSGGGGGGDKLRKSPKSKRDRSRPAVHRQTPLIKSTKSSPCEDKYSKSHKTKQSSLSVLHTSSVIDSFSDMPIITAQDYNNDVDDESPSGCRNSPLLKFAQRRRSRSEEPSRELRNCDITPVKMISNYCENVNNNDDNSIIDCVASPDSSFVNNNNRMMNRCTTNDADDGDDGSITQSPGASNTDLRWSSAGNKNKYGMITKSAPNSPYTPNPIKDNCSFGRISLRRRAILRLPVTPSKRAAGQSNRQRSAANSPASRNPLQSTPSGSNSPTVAKSSSSSAAASSSSSLCKNNSMSSTKQSFIDHNHNNNNHGNSVIDNNSN